MEPIGDPLGLTGSLPSSQDNQGTQPESTGSPKPFDASLFDNLEDAPQDQSGFLFQESLNEPMQQSPSTPESTVEQSGDDPMLSMIGGIPIEPQSDTGDNGYESQPIGSPGSQLKWAGSSSAQALADPQPVVCELFENEHLASDNLEGKSFFDSFTSGGEPSSFITPPQSLGSLNAIEKEEGLEEIYEQPKSLAVLEEQKGLNISVDLGSHVALDDGLDSPLDSGEQHQQALDDDQQFHQTLPSQSPKPPRELFSTLSLEEDDSQGNADPDTQSIDLLLDQPEACYEAVESTHETIENTSSVPPQSPKTSSLTLLEQSKLATGHIDLATGPVEVAQSEQILPSDNSAGVIHNTDPHPLSPQTPQGGQMPPQQTMQLDTFHAGVIHDTSPHQLTPQSPQDRLSTFQQSPISSEPPRTIFSPGHASPSSHAFSCSLSQDGDDPFAAALSISESDRRHDAWLPSDATQRVLATRLASLQGTEYVDRKQLTMPGVIADEPQGDPLKDLVYRYMGEAEATQRKALTLNQVTRDRDGLCKLLENGCLRAAVDLTALLLATIGQGKGQLGLPSRHTPESLQIWFIRIGILIKLQQYTLADKEFEAFGNLDQPDLYFEYYPDLYPGRKGSMVSFSLRIIHAEMPQYTGKHQEALDRLYHILDICNKIINNLESDLSEFGTNIELTAEKRNASLNLWKLRQVRTLYCTGNCLLAMKDYNRAACLYESLCDKDTSNHSSLLSAIGRIFLQLGDLKSAQAFFQRVEDMKMKEHDGHMAKVFMNKGFLSLAENQYSEANQHFEDVLKIQPDNFTAINNIAVCLLYMGHLKEALTRLESLVQSNPEKYLDEALLFNLCTLYELESSRSGYKKQSLLGMLDQGSHFEEKKAGEVDDSEDEDEKSDSERESSEGSDDEE